MSTKALAMTQEDLIKFFEKQVQPMMEKYVGTAVADIVKDNMEKQIAEARKANAGSLAPLFNGDGETKQPRKREKGEAAARIMRAYALCAFEKRSAREAGEYLKAWGDEDLCAYVKQGQQNYEVRMKAMGVSTPTAGGTLVPEQFSQDIIEYLRPMSVVRNLVGSTLPMPVGTVRIPKITQGSTAYYQGENANATASSIQTGSITMTFRKLVGLIPISNDLLRYSSPGADAIVRNDMVRAIAQAENNAFLRGDGTAGSPRGLRYWAQGGNITKSAGTSLANMTTDLSNAILSLKNNNVPMTRCAWIMAPRTEQALLKIQNTNGFYVFRDEMLRKQLWGFPYATTTQVPTNLTDWGGTTETELYLVDFDEVVIGESMNLAVDASSEAAYYDGASVQAAYSQDQTVVRCITEHDLAVRRDQAIAIINGVTWS